MKHIKELREEKGISQQELADMLDVHRTAIAKYESGANSAKSEILEKLADIFDVSVDYLLGRTEEKSPIPEGIELNKTQIEIVELLTHAPEEKQSVLLAVFQAVLSGGEEKPPADAHQAP